MALTLSSPQDTHSIARSILFCPAEERTVKTLHELPKGEREQLWADMTGHPEAMHFRVHAETSEFVEANIDSLSHLIDSFMPCNNPELFALKLAVQQDHLYVNAQKLKFLRADDFNPEKAVVRMIAFFTLKLDLFGPELLTKDIRQEDLSDDDLESLAGGGMQLLPDSDHASRGVIFTRASNYVYKDRKNMLRAFFYLAQKATSIEHFQKVGFVSVSYQVGGYPEGGYDFELTRCVSQLVKAFPIRFVAIYLCYSITPWQRVADLISHLLTPLLRVRLRSVQGSHQECLYKLMALGIPHRSIPVGNEGQNFLTNHLKWIKSRRMEEDLNSTSIP